MTAALEGRGLRLDGRGGPRLDVPSLRLDAEDFNAVVGPNGSGKTSLLRALLGLERGLEGEVRYGDEDVRRMSPRDRAARLGWLPQRELLLDAVFVDEYLLGACLRFGMSRSAAVSRARARLEAFGLGALWGVSVLTLSGGERQRLSMVALDLQESDWWLCDEPANHLDPAQQLRVYEGMSESWRAGQAVVCVTHDVNLLWGVAPPSERGRVRVLGMRDGGLAFDRRLDDPGLPEALGELYGVGVATLEGPGGPSFQWIPAAEDGR